MAGCDRSDVIGELRRRGLWNGCGDTRPLDPAERERQQREREARAAQRARKQAWMRERALEIFHEARPALGTPAEFYLTWWRGVDCGAERRAWWRQLLTDVIRFHPACPRGHIRQPAMVALMRSIADDRPTGIHRTFLKCDGDKDGDRKMLGSSGSAVIKLIGAPPCRSLAIAEGIEKALGAVLRGYVPAGCAVWAPGSADALKLFPVIDGVGELIILADNEPVGLKAAHQAVDRWRRVGRQTHVVPPPKGEKDFDEPLKL